ncbi:hypothetical protein [Verrucomicrobium spinosum]|uniref:hypothetical protein n=1 Tax=Verrucomicrobium spinosum TaxID=2736 RepID=UPI0009465DA1|nr:hypothetical protein [Verrucomicrobium spinosum]
MAAQGRETGARCKGRGAGSGGVVEWWSGGVVEWWSGGVVEWCGDRSGVLRDWWSMDRGA